MLFMTSISMSYIFDSTNLTVEISEDGKASFVLVLQGVEEGLKFVLPIDISYVNTTCSYRLIETGYLFSCPPSNKTIISGIMKARAIQRKDLKIMTIYFKVSDVHKNLTTILYLPKGTGLAPEKKTIDLGFLPAEPTPYRTITDGRRIGIIWNVEKPELGKTIVFRVAYESKRSTLIFLTLIPVVLVSIIGFIIFRKKDNILHVLDPDERKVYEIILRERRISQNKIVRSVDMSKATVSRIIKRLEDKNLIKKERKGRVNIIEVVRK